jgi:hypothetical protein
MGIYKSMNSDKFKSAQRVATRYAAQAPDLDRLATVIDWLDEGFPDMFERDYLEFGDPRPLENALSDYVSSLRGLLEQGRKEEAAQREQERLERERLERERQEKERQEKERRDTLKKLDRLAKKVFKDWHQDRSGIGGEWLLASYADDGRGSYPTAQRAVESFIGQAQKLVGGSPSFQFKEHRDEGSVGGSLKNSRMFNIEIMGDAYIQGRTSGSMADLTVTVEPKE